MIGGLTMELKKTIVEAAETKDERKGGKPRISSRDLMPESRAPFLGISQRPI